MLHQVPRVPQQQWQHFMQWQHNIANIDPWARECSTVVILQCWGMLLPWNCETKAQVTF